MGGNDGIIRTGEPLGGPGPRAVAWAISDGPVGAARDVNLIPLGGGDVVVFPVKPELTGEPYQPRKFAPAVILAEPSYVVYRRLYFEEKNSERYGWDLGPIQPLVSTLAFLKDAVMLPHNIFAYPCRRWETNAGQCQPGDPVPYLCYPPEITWSGVLAEVSTIGMIIAIVP